MNNSNRNLNNTGIELLPEVVDVRLVLIRELKSFRREVELLPDDATLWKVLPGITNSVGTLALHVAGNLRHFVGAVLGGTTYKRNREAEFALRDLPRSKVIAELNRAIEEVEEGMQTVNESMLSEKFPVALKGITMPTRRFLMGLVTHTSFHLGQAGYLRRILTADITASDAVSLVPLAYVKKSVAHEFSD